MSTSSEGPTGSGGSTAPANQAESEQWSNIEGIRQKSRPDGSELSMDEVFELLKNPRRRMVISYLKENGNTATLSDVAEHIAASENGISVQELSSDQRKRVYIGLYQCHLPKMDNFGVVDYDKNRGTIKLRESVAQLDSYIDSEEDGGIDAALLSIVIAVLISTVVLAGIASVGPLGLVPDIFYTFLSVAGILGITLFHYFV